MHTHGGGPEQLCTSWEYMSSHDRVFINRKGKIQSVLLGDSQRIGWTMFFTEKHMVKNSHRLGNREKHREKYTFLMPWENTSDITRRPTSIQPLGKTRKDRRNAKLNVPVATLHRFTGKKDASSSLEWEAHLGKAR